MRVEYDASSREGEVDTSLNDCCGDGAVLLGWSEAVEIVAGEHDCAVLDYEPWRMETVRPTSGQ